MDHQHPYPTVPQPYVSKEYYGERRITDRRRVVDVQPGRVVSTKEYFINESNEIVPHSHSVYTSPNSLDPSFDQAWTGTKVLTPRFGEPPQATYLNSIYTSDVGQSPLVSSTASPYSWGAHVQPVSPLSRCIYVNNIPHPLQPKQSEADVRRPASFKDNTASRKRSNSVPTKRREVMMKLPSPPILASNIMPSHQPVMVYQQAYQSHFVPSDGFQPPVNQMQHQQILSKPKPPQHVVKAKPSDFAYARDTVTSRARIMEARNRIEQLNAVLDPPPPPPRPIPQNPLYADISPRIYEASAMAAASITKPYLIKKSWDPVNAGEYKRTAAFRSLIPDVGARLPRPLRGSPTVQEYTIYAAPKVRSPSQRLLEPDIVRTLKRSPMHPELLREWLSRYCDDTSDDWLQCWVDAWNSAESDNESDESEEIMEIQLPGTSRLPRVVGKRRALLVGGAYKRKTKVKCTSDDVESMEKFLNKNGYRPHNRRLLCDLEDFDRPTMAAIIDGCRWLVKDAQPGDSLFFYYSGSGVEDDVGSGIVPSDSEQSGIISDDVLYELLIRPLPRACRLTIFIDCHRNAVNLDLPFECLDNLTLICRNPIDIIKPDVLLFSDCVCQDSPMRTYSASEACKASPMTRAFIFSFQHCKRNPPYIRDIVTSMDAQLKNGPCSQLPILSASLGYSLQQEFTF